MAEAGYKQFFLGMDWMGAPPANEDIRTAEALSQLSKTHPKWTRRKSPRPISWGLVVILIAAALTADRLYRYSRVKQAG